MDATTLSVLIALRTERDPGAALRPLLTLSTLLTALTASHGVVSGELRTGITVLWLQKPVPPVRFYLERGARVVCLVALLTLSLGGAVAACGALFGGPEVGRELLLRVPTAAVAATCLAVVVVGLSSWGTHLDSMLALVLFYASLFTVELEGGWAFVPQSLAVPVEALASLNGALMEGSASGLGEAVLSLGRFVAVWTLVAGTGLALSTRRPSGPSAVG